MLKAELSTEALTACYEAVKQIIEHLGVADQEKGNRGWMSGNLALERTNTGHTEVTVKGRVVLSVPLAGSSEQSIWQPGDWVKEVDAVYRRIER